MEREKDDLILAPCALGIKRPKAAQTQCHTVQLNKLLICRKIQIHPSPLPLLLQMPDAPGRPTVLSASPHLQCQAATNKTAS